MPTCGPREDKIERYLKGGLREYFHLTANRRSGSMPILIIKGGAGPYALLKMGILWLITMKGMFGYHCKEMKLEETEERSNEIRAKFDRYAAQFIWRNRR